MELLNGFPRIPRRLTSALIALAVALAAAGLQLANANPAQSQSTRLFAWEANEDPGVDPDNEVWSERQPIEVRLISQGGTYFGGKGSISMLQAQARQFDGRLYVRVEWADATEDTSTARAEQFADAVAVQFPAKSATSVPTICMGQADGGVNIWQWRADSEAGPRDPADVYANTLSDGYPVQFYTARDAGNPYSRLEAGPVQNLVAQAFGTLSKFSVQDVQGHGVYRDGRWAVVFSRGFEGAASSQASFREGTRTDVAFAVWNGSEGQRNGNKSISQFVTLSITALPPAGGRNSWTVGLAVGSLLLLTALGFGLATFGVSRKAR